jgi:hypothetical protein
MDHPQVNQQWRLSKNEGGPTKHSLYITWYGTTPDVMYIVSSIGYLVQYQVLYILPLPGMIPGSTWYQTDHPQNKLPWHDGCHVGGSFAVFNRGFSTVPQYAPWLMTHEWTIPSKCALCE